MHFSTIVAPLAMAGAALAQSAPAPSGSVMVQVVKVGGNNGELTFSPNNIQAPVGSMVQFQFYPKNHSVAQSTFGQPCMPISQTQPNVTTPLWSGFMPTEPNAPMMATYTVMVNNTTPIWLYCAQGDHCQKGMVAAINANNATGKTIDAFTQNAMKATQNIAPSGMGMNGSMTTGSNGSSPSSGSPSSSSTPSGSSAPQGKVGNAASTLSYSGATVALAGLLSAVVGFAL